MIAKKQVIAKKGAGSEGWGGGGGLGAAPAPPRNPPLESPLKMMKNAFYFILKSPFVLKIHKFLSRLFGHVGKKLD